MIEIGIGESRWALVEDGEIVEARVLVEGVVPAGSVLEAKLIDIGRGGHNAVALAEGEEYLLPEAPSGVSQGAALEITVTRERIPGNESWKRPLARVAQATFVGNQSAGEREIAMPARTLDEAGWDDLLEEARSGIIRFKDGELRVSVTPAMTLIDVDGTLPPTELAIAGARASSRAIRRHGIGGSIGIDLPTIQGKGRRNAIGEMVDATLPKPFERTAVNGFGFLQIVRPRCHASLFEIAADRAAFEGRALLRRTALSGSGPRRLVAHPAVIAVLERRPDWLDALERQIGGGVSLRADASRPISSGDAEPS